MSALPEQALKPHKVSGFLRTLTERTDDALLTDEELYQLKGGDTNQIFKTLVGISAVVGYLYIFRRSNIINMEITGSAFLWSNVIFLSTTTLFQKLNNSSRNVKDKIDLHNSALYLRIAENWQFFKDTKKASIH